MAQQKFNFYCSNTDKTKTSDTEGLWISYKTISGDHNALNFGNREITTISEAQTILEQDLEEEWEAGVFCATAKSFGFHK